MTQYGLRSRKRPTTIGDHLNLIFWMIAYQGSAVFQLFCSLFITKAFAGEWPLESLLTTATVELSELEAEKEDEVENNDSDHLEVSSSNAQ